MAINKVTFNSVNFWDQLGAALTAPVAYPIPAEIKEQIKIKGMNGSLTEATGYFNNLEIELNFKVLIGKGNLPDAKTFPTLKRKINQIFNNINDTKLSFSDIPEKYYKVKSCVVGAVAKISDYEAEFDVKFTCDPFLYLQSEGYIGQGGFTYSGDISNAPYIVFNARNNSLVTITCNSRSLTFTPKSRGKIEINKNPYSIVTENGAPLESKGVQPIFSPGRNEISVTGDIEGLEIYRNERYLG